MTPSRTITSLSSPSTDRPGTPLITSILASYNRADTIERAFEGFRRQSYPAKELVVIDGASTDGTRSLIAANRDIVAYTVSEPDAGILDAWNKGIQNSHGEWIHFLGADDYYYDDRVFANVMSAIDTQKIRSKIVYGMVDRVDSAGRLVEHHGGPWRPDAFRTVGFNIPHTGTFHHRSLFEEYGLFDASVEIGLCYEMLLRYLKNHDAVCLPDITVACMIVGGESNQPGTSLKFVRETRRAQRLHNTYGFSPKRTLDFAKAYIKLWLMTLLPEPLGRILLDAIRLFRGRRRMYTR